MNTQQARFTFAPGAFGASHSADFGAPSDDDADDDDEDGTRALPAAAAPLFAAAAPLFAAAVELVSLSLNGRPSCFL